MMTLKGAMNFQLKCCPVKQEHSKDAVTKAAACRMKRRLSLWAASSLHLHYHCTADIHKAIVRSDLSLPVVWTACL